MGAGLGIVRAAQLTRGGSVAQVSPTQGLRKSDDLHACPIAHGPVALLWVGTASLHHLQLFTSCEECIFVTPKAALDPTSL